MSCQETPLQKDLRIKSGALKRTHKECLSYQKEEEQMAAKLQEYENSGNVDEYDLKKKKELFEETKQMLPYTKTRLQECYNEMVSWIEENGDSPDVCDTELRQATDEIIQDVNEFLESLNSQVGEDNE